MMLFDTTAVVIVVTIEIKSGIAVANYGNGNERGGCRRGDRLLAHL
ncbi:hypothetical protein PI125_g25325 [Phytophthora idaei]|nr:hypothetical protein PI125_g25325 [Phytophthora idaei]